MSAHVLCPACFAKRKDSEEKCCAHGTGAATCVRCGASRPLDGPYWPCAGTLVSDQSARLVIDDQLRRLLDDPEAGHARLEDLLEDLLIAIRNTPTIEHAKKLATLGLEAIEAVPERWYS